MQQPLPQPYVGGRYLKHPFDNDGRVCVQVGSAASYGSSPCISTSCLAYNPRPLTDANCRKNSGASAAARDASPMCFGEDVVAAASAAYALAPHRPDLRGNARISAAFGQARVAASREAACMATSPRKDEACKWTCACSCLYAESSS